MSPKLKRLIRSYKKAYEEGTRLQKVPNGQRSHNWHWLVGYNTAKLTQLEIRMDEEDGNWVKHSRELIDDL